MYGRYCMHFFQILLVLNVVQSFFRYLLIVTSANENQRKKKSIYCLKAKSFFFENRVNSKSALFRILHLVNMMVTPILVDVQSILAHQCFQNSIHCSTFADTELRFCTLDMSFLKKMSEIIHRKKKLVLKILPTISNILENSLKQ